ncbi:MAG: hypothetical protein ABH826_05470 [Patescibacteria group bacterium]
MNIFIWLRQFRVAGYAIFDLTASFLVVYFLAPYLTKLFRKLGVAIPRSSWLFLILPIAIIVHKIFGISTPLTEQFFFLDGFISIKIFVLLLLVMGLKDIRAVKR